MNKRQFRLALMTPSDKNGLRSLLRKLSKAARTYPGFPHLQVLHDMMRAEGKFNWTKDAEDELAEALEIWEYAAVRDHGKAAVPESSGESSSATDVYIGDESTGGPKCRLCGSKRPAPPMYKRPKPGRYFNPNVPKMSIGRVQASGTANVQTPKAG